MINSTIPKRASRSLRKALRRHKATVTVSSYSYDYSDGFKATRIGHCVFASNSSTDELLAIATRLGRLGYKGHICVEGQVSDEAKKEVLDLFEAATEPVTRVVALKERDEIDEWASKAAMLRSWTPW